MSDDPVLPVLHALRLRSFATVEVLADQSGLAPEVVRSALQEADASGWARHRDGRLSGWSLSADGRAHAQELLAHQLDAAGARTAVESAYVRFMDLNGELLSVCTDWQVVVVDGTELVNDHTDAAHDDAVLRRLDALHERSRPITADLAEALDRFGAYPVRLDSAHARVRAGDLDWLTKPMIDSYHTVWFELHEDLLATLGRERSQEQSVSGAPG
jgi:hypothetical protein